MVFGKLKFYFKSFVYGSLICGCGLYGVLLSIVLRLIGKKELCQWTVARAFYHSCNLLLGLKVTIKNEERLNSLPAIIISNHQSAVDVFMLGKLFQPGYTVTAKKVLKYFPFLGWFMALSGTFFIDRAKGSAARKVLEKALQQVKTEKKGVFMFPEGTRSGSDKLELLPFKKGAFFLAKDAGVPIIPVVVGNYSTVFHSNSNTFNRGEILLEVLEPISTADVETAEDVAALCE